MIHFAVSEAQSPASCMASQNFCTNPSFPLTNTGGVGLTGAASYPSGSNPATPPQGGTLNSGCMFANVPNPQWMLLTVSSNGSLGFSLGAAGSPNPQLGFYDWILYPVVGSLANTCNQIFAGNFPPSSCVWNCASSGGTGMGTVPPGAQACNYAPSIPVTAGQQFIYLFSNWSSASGNVTFQSTGSAGLSCSPLIIPNVTACPNQTVSTTAMWLGVSNAVTYTINPGNIVQTSSVITVSAPSTQVYTVLAQSTNTSGTIINSQTTFTLTTNPNTTLAISSPTNYCYGSSITFSVNPSGATSYSVVGPSFPQTIYSSSNISIPNATPSNIGTFSVIANYPSGCIGTGTVPVNVAGNYSITPNLPINVCQSGTANLTASMSAAANATAYTWVGPNSFNSTVQNPTIPNILPASSGIYTVSSAINFNTVNCPVTNTTQVSVVATNPVNVTSSYTLCQTATLTLNAIAAGLPTYAWSGPGAYSSAVQNPTISNIMPSSNGIYTVTASFTNSAITCTQSAVTTVSVVATSPVNITMPANVCQYANVSLSAAAPGAIGFNWTGPNAFSSSVASPSFANAQPQASGIYYATATFAIGSVSCTTQGQSNLGVVPVNSITVNAPISICEPANTSLSAASPGAITYSWTGPNSFTSNISNPLLFNAYANASGIYSVTASFNNGALTCYNSNTVSLTVNPILNFTLVPWQQICYNTPISINGPAGATSYTWSTPFGQMINTQNLSIPISTPTMSGNYQLVVNLGPCTTSATSQVDILTPIQFTQTPSNQTICNGDSVKFLMGSQGGSGNYAYSWNPQVFLAAANGSFVIGKPSGTTVYNVLGYDIACPTNTISYGFTVQVNQAPQPNLILNKLEGCQPFCLPLNSHTQGQAALITYDFGGTTQVQNDSITYCINQPGTYKLKIITKGLNGCSGIYAYPRPIIVDPLPGSDFNWTPDQPTINENRVTFIPSNKAGVVLAYHWQFLNPAVQALDTSADKTPARMYEQLGKYPVMLVSTTDKGCKDTAVKFLEINDDFVVYIPNTFTPNGDGLNDMFTVKGSGVLTNGFSMNVFDRWGALIYSTSDITKGWDGTFKGINAQEGVYVYKIKVNSANGQGKKDYVGHVTLLR
ncbi:MAG: gliding motility-associated C-terminal domain-containing protein [Bacteroidetes bacterium]|nr:gliding motility-associated C-terminal domain-containing protein [Bacteroidota bacterium]